MSHGEASENRKRVTFMKFFMRVTLGVMTFLILSACAEVGDYYVLINEREEPSISRLYPSEDIFVFLHHFDGNTSRMEIYSRDTENDLQVELLSLEHSLFIDDISQQPVSSRDDTQGALDADPESRLLYKIAEIYKFETPPEFVTEKINIELLVNGNLVNISKEFPLKRVSYNQLTALWNM